MYLVSIIGCFCVAISKKSLFMCAVDGFRCRSRWPCPKQNCSFAFCRRHMRQAEADGVPLKLKAQDFQDVNSKNSPDSHDLEDYNMGNEENKNYRDSNVFAGFEEALFAGPVSDGTKCNKTSSTYETDSAAKFIPVVEEKDVSSDTNFLPVQVLFNVVNSVLVRPTKPISTNLRFKQFLKCFVAKTGSPALSLVQMEALLIPSIFFYQIVDGSCPGALPFFIFCCQKRHNS